MIRFWKNVKVQMTSWLSDITNGIGRIFTKELCIARADGSSVCLDANELEAIKNGRLTLPTLPVIPDPTLDPVPPTPTTTAPVTCELPTVLNTTSNSCETPEPITPPTDPVTPPVTP